MKDAEEARAKEAAGPEWATLAALRERIDQVDHALVSALAARYRLAEEVGILKGGSGLAVLDPAREAEIVRRAGEAARAEGLPEEGVRQLFWAVLDYCREGVRGRHRLEQILANERVPVRG